MGKSDPRDSDQLETMAELSPEDRKFFPRLTNGAARLLRELAELKGSKPNTEASRLLENLVSSPEFQSELKAFREQKDREKLTQPPTNQE